MTNRTAAVTLRMHVRDYIIGSQQAIGANRQLQASQRALGAEADRSASALTRAGEASERSGRRMGRGMLYSAAGVAALAAAGGGIKALPPLLAAAATGGAALPGVLLGAAAGAGVLKVAVSGVGKALGEVTKQTDPFKNLAPNARALVGEYARLRPLMQSFQQGLQERTFAGTAQGLNLLATQSLPKVSAGLNVIADDWSNVFAEIALMANSPEVIGAFNTVTGTADRFFDQITERVRPIGASIGTLLMSADPVVREFGDGLVGMIDRFNAAVERGRQSGSLAEVFAGGTAAARELMSISESVLRITGMVIREASATNDATGGAADSLRAYVESGRAAADVAGVVRTLTTAWEGMRDVLAPLGALVRDALADPGLAASVGQLFQVLAAGAQTISGVLSMVLALNNASGGLLLALVGLALAASKLNTVIALTSAAAARGAVALGRYGAAGARAGTMLERGAGGAGKLLGALLALEVAHQLFAAFKDDAANVDALGKSIEGLATNGAIAGEMTRLFGENLDDMGTQAKFATDDNFFANFLRGAEEALPITRDLAEALGAGAHTFTGSAENFAALDASIAKYGATTNDVKGTTEAWNRVMAESGLSSQQLAKVLPSTWAELTRMQTEAHGAAGGAAALAERTELLNAPLEEAVTLGRSLLDVFNELNGGAINFAKAQMSAEEAVDQLAATLDKNGLALNRQKDGFNINTEKGRENLNLTLSLAEAASKAAQARLDEGGTIEQAAGVYDQYIGRLRSVLAAQGATPGQIEAIIGSYTQMPAALESAGAAANSLNTRLSSIPKGATFTFNGQSLVDGEGKTIELANGIRGLPPGKKFTWNGNSLVDGKGKVYAVKAAVQELQPSKTIRINAQTGGAISNVRTLANVMGAVQSKTVSLTVTTNYSSARAAEHRMGQRWGGVVHAYAGGGVFEPEIAAPGTRIKWAEPETGGEAYIPRRGNTGRSRQILDVAAGWYGMRTVPMAAGGIVTAATGSLVNVAPRTVSSTQATRLDWAEAYLRAKDAVAALGKALKENGRSFSHNTAKGRENRTAVYSAIRAAQDAAKTKYEETGSIAAANKAYDEHIRKLRATLKQQKVNNATINALLATAQRPTYAAKPPSNSSARVASVRDQISAEESLAGLKESFAWGRPSFNIKTEAGRTGMTTLLSFLAAAESAAQSSYQETGNSKTATALYNAYLNQLRQTLKASGVPAKEIENLLKSYGRITLQRNETGGVYGPVMMASGGVSSSKWSQLNQAKAWAGGTDTMYGFREKSTGGELFLPRLGDRGRGEDILKIGAGWYGGTYSRGGGPAGRDGRLTIELISRDGDLARMIDVRVSSKFGALADAVVLGTADGT